MKKEEYDLEKQKIIREYNQKRYELDREFAMSNSPLQHGDFATDHMGTIFIETIEATNTVGSNYPCCLYKGPCYTKKGKPIKNEKHRAVYQTNLTSV